MLNFTAKPQRFNVYGMLIILAAGLLVISCSAQNNNEEVTATNENEKPAILIPEGRTVGERFNTPEGYDRIRVDTGSFGQYLRNLKLRPFGEKVHYYDGRTKSPGNVYLSVVDLDVGNRDLQQCADAVMRLRAEYLYGEQRYADIHFNFVSDGKPRYFTDYAGGDLSYQKFRKYLDYIFSYANTASLHDELAPVEELTEIKPGDVFVQKGNPYGHAVIVLDVAAGATSGERIFLLAQSYMPAQEIQVLVNPNDPSISPWFRLDETLITPEWTFKSFDLRRFEE